MNTLIENFDFILAIVLPFLILIWAHIAKPEKIRVLKISGLSLILGRAKANYNEHEAREIAVYKKAFIFILFFYFLEHVLQPLLIVLSR